MPPAVLALALLQFTGPTGGRVDINPDAISSIRDPANITAGHFASGTQCVLVMMNGHPVPVREPCDEVRDMVKERGAPCVLVCGEAPGPGK